MIPEKLNQLIETITQKYSSQELFAAKKEYQKISGEIFEDDKSYESRMGSFLEWFTFDRPLNNSSETPLQEYLDGQREPLSEADKELCENISKSIHGMFVLKKAKSDLVMVYELLDDKKYQVKEEQGEMLFNKGAVFEARMIPFGGQFFFSDNFCYHSKEVTGFIKTKIKELRANEKNDLKNLAQNEKELQAIQKKHGKVISKRNKLKIKLSKANAEKKINKISQELNQWELLNDELAQQVEALENDLRDLKQKTIEIGHRDNRFQLIRRLSYMSLKWERSRQIEVRDIYQD